MNPRDVIADAIGKRAEEVLTLLGFTPLRASSDECEPVADAILAALNEAGFAVVPKEPTKAMIEAGDDLMPVARGTETHAMVGGVVPEDYWSVMLAAAEEDNG